MLDRQADTENAKLECSKCQGLTDLNPIKNNEPNATRFERMKEELAAQAATLALERERLKELDRRLTEWACELAARAASLNEREEARTSRIYDFRVCFDDPSADGDDQSASERAEVTTEPSVP